ncbi:MAG: hypothetical protein AAGN66_21685 [Acidobacteriota bacterium]
MTKREFQHSGGRILQCMGCGAIGVEFGTSYMTFSEQEFLRFSRWFLGLEWESSSLERGKLRVGMDGDSSLMLSLNQDEHRSLAALFAQGTMWLEGSGLVGPHLDGLQCHEVSATVH